MLKFPKQCYAAILHRADDMSLEQSCVNFVKLLTTRQLAAIMGYHFPSGVIGSHVCLLEITRGQNL
jgi:hypothetical protein